MGKEPKYFKKWKMVYKGYRQDFLCTRQPCTLYNTNNQLNISEIKFFGMHSSHDEMFE